ncbi:MAG: DinB family protein [Mobilitalea sp.]
MQIVTSDWSNRHKKLNKIIKKEDLFPVVSEMILDLHKELHTSKVSKSEKNAVDLLLEDLQENEFAIMPTSKDETIAWAIWHIARIEDLTMNILVKNDAQIFNEKWKQQMNISISDTGNAMNDREIMEFSKQICTEELLKYRDAVGIRSREIIQNLSPKMMKQGVMPEGIARILQEGGVTKEADSLWLLDFWSKKDIAGIVLMPLTRHQTLHLNDCYKWKNEIRKKKNFFST